MRFDVRRDLGKSRKQKTKKIISENNGSVKNAG